MDCSKYVSAEVSCLSRMKDYDSRGSDSSYTQPEPYAVQGCKRRSSIAKRRSVAAEGSAICARYSPSPLSSRARKVRHAPDCLSGDAAYTCCNQGTIGNGCRSAAAVKCNSLSSVYCPTTIIDIRNTGSPNNGVGNENGRTPNDKGTQHHADSRFPPSSLGVLENPEHYTELSFADYRAMYDRLGPVMFESSLVDGLKSNLVELRMLKDTKSILISQNSTQRVVYNAYWLPKQFPMIAIKVAVKSVMDFNLRDGRSIKREIGCHLYIYQQLMAAAAEAKTISAIAADDWPTSELLGYYLDKKNPGNSILVTRKLIGPDFFDIIRSECSPQFSIKNKPLYELNKLDWCIIALERVAQLSELGIRHNDIKPDNIVLDMYEIRGVKRVDVKVIDLGAASMEDTKEFTGGTSWYESPEQKVLEFYTKKHHNLARAATIEIGQASDAWGAGHSIIEVLVGRRMVDYASTPQCKDAPEMTNPPQEVDEEAKNHLWWNKDEYWTIPPRVWLERIRTALKLDAPVQKFPICAKAARYVYDQLMHVDPRKRATVRSVAEGLRLMAQEEVARYMSII